MVTDLAEVERLGTAKAGENLDFRRHLAAHHCAEEPFQILASEVQQYVDCTTCANCCRHSVVPVNPSEIEKIASYLGMEPAATASFYTVPDPGDATSRILKSGTDGCVFLDHNLCMIYDVRPKTCRDFPHLSLRKHTLGSRLSSHARWASLCPIIFNALESYKHLVGFHPHRSHASGDPHNVTH